MTKLFLGDAVDVMRREIATGSVDMVYSDPPFGNEQVWTGRAGSFDDRWKWNAMAAAGWEDLRKHCPTGHAIIASTVGHEAGRAYLGALAGIILEIRRVLKKTGTLWLHFDDTMGAYLRLLCSSIFGQCSEVGTLIWVRTLGGHANAKGFGRVHDTIAVYARSRAALWRLWRIGTIGGDPCSPDWHYRFDGSAGAAPLNPSDSERIGYPTQKPVALLEELISAATLRGDVVLDPTMGSGTAVVAAGRLSRKGIGIDMSPDALATAKQRLFGKPSAQAAFDFGAVA